MFNPVLFIYIVIGVFINIYASLNMGGLYNYDEHFQIIEFVSLKLGITLPSEMAWEYHEAIRPWAQPFIYYLIIKFLNITQIITNHYTQIEVVRTLSALFAFYCQTLFILKVKDLFATKTERYFVLYAFLLLFPIYLINSRVSCENFSASLVILAVYYLLKIKENTANMGYTIGMFAVCSMLAFQFRYLLLFFVFLLFVYGLYSAKEKFRFLKFYTLGALCVTILCGLIDIWGYEKFTIPFIGYLKFNYVLDISKIFGVSPFYDYFKKLSDFMNPSFFYFFATGIIISLFYAKLRPIALAIIAYFLFVSFIPHKETRFLFPILFLAFLCSILAIFKLTSAIKIKYVHIILATAVFLFLMGCNFYLVVKYIFNPFNSEHRIIRYIEENIDSEKIFLIQDSKNAFYLSLDEKNHTNSYVWPIPKHVDSNTNFISKNTDH